KKTVRQQSGNRRNRSFIGNKARCEDETSFLAVQIGQFVFKLHQRMVVAGNIARTAGTRARIAGCVAHSLDDIGMVSHAKIVIGTPHGDLTGSAIVAPDSSGETSDNTFKICKNAVTLLG